MKEKKELDFLQMYQDYVVNDTTFKQTEKNEREIFFRRSDNFSVMQMLSEENAKKLLKEPVAVIQQYIKVVQENRNVLQMLPPENANKLLELPLNDMKKRMFILSSLIKFKGEFNTATFNFIMDPKNAAKVETLYKVFLEHENTAKSDIKHLVQNLIDNKMPHFYEILDKLLETNQLTINNIDKLDQKTNLGQSPSAADETKNDANKYFNTLHQTLTHTSTQTIKTKGLSGMESKLTQYNAEAYNPNKFRQASQAEKIKIGQKIKTRLEKSKSLENIENAFAHIDNKEDLNKYLHGKEFADEKKILDKHQNWYAIGKKTDASKILDEMIKEKMEILTAAERNTIGSEKK